MSLRNGYREPRVLPRVDLYRQADVLRRGAVPAHSQTWGGLWSPGRALNPRPLPLREHSIEALLPRQRFRLLLDIYQAEPPGLRWSQNDLLIKFRLGRTPHFHGHIAATSGLRNDKNMLRSSASVVPLLKQRFVYSLFTNRFYQTFKTTPSWSSGQRIIRRKKEDWSSDVHHADTTTEMTPSSAQAAEVHSSPLEHQ